MTDTAQVDTQITTLRERARQGLARALAPLVNWLDGQNVTADQLSWLGFGIAVLAALLAGFRVFIAAGILYLFVGIVDLLDGALARRGNIAGARGAFLDSLLDRAGEGAIHAGAAVAFAYWGIWIGVLAVALSLAGGYLTSYARARAEGLGIALPEVWFGRGERLVLLALGLIFHFALVAFWILAVLGWLSAAHRAWLAWRRLEPEPEAFETYVGSPVDVADPPPDFPRDPD
ncbi:MAG: CDP-alcohol phosphatidyltransferase family protein [Gammaproteobacteria bacterium]